jgi:hypothetical protein
MQVLCPLAFGEYLLFHLESLQLSSWKLFWFSPCIVMSWQYQSKLDISCLINYCGNFSLQHRVQNGSGAHPPSYPMGIRGSFPGGKAAGAWSWTLTSISCRGQRMSGAIPTLPQYAFLAWCSVKAQGQLYLYYFNVFCCFCKMCSVVAAYLQLLKNSLITQILLQNGPIHPPPPE